MLSVAIARLENENIMLREALQELSDRLENGEYTKPKSCQYCKYYRQHFMKAGSHYKVEYIPLYMGHCILGVPINKGGKKTPVPDDVCAYFEIGTVDME